MDALIGPIAAERLELAGRVALRVFALVGLDACLRSGVDAAIPGRGAPGVLRFAVLAALRAWAGKHTAARPQAWRVERHRRRAAARRGSDGLLARLWRKRHGGGKTAANEAVRAVPKDATDEAARAARKDAANEAARRSARSPRASGTLAPVFAPRTKAPAGLGVPLPARRQRAEASESSSVATPPPPPSPSPSLSSASSEEGRATALSLSRPAGLGVALPTRSRELRA